MKKVLDAVKSFLFDLPGLVASLQSSSINRFRATVYFFAVITVFMLYPGNYLTPEKSVVPKDAVESDNPVRQMDLRVDEKKKEGFLPDEPAVITKKFSRGIKSVRDLRAILDLDDFLRRELGKRGLDSDRLISPATIPRFKDDGVELRGDYYVNPEMFNGPGLNVEEWKRWVKEDSSIYGVYISRDFKTAFFRFYVEDNTEEKAVVWKIKADLEQKKFGWLDRFIEIDIRPKDKDLGLLGWIVGRWLIGQLAIINILTITTGAALFSVFGFQRALGSWVQASVSLIMFFLTIIWARGTVGFMALAGSSVGESPYLLFSYAVFILQGVSFSLQIFIAYNRVRKQGLAPGEAWKKITGTNLLISLLASISIGSFVSLWWSFGVRPIVDMAITSSIGLTYLWIFSRFLLPALYLYLEAKREIFQKIAAWLWPFKLVFWPLAMLEKYFFGIIVEYALKAILRISAFLITEKNIVASAAAVICLIIVLTGAAFHEIVWPNHKLLAESEPLAFIPGSLVYETSQELNQEGQIGFEGLNFLLRPKWRQTDGIYNPRFLSAVSQIKRGIADFPKEIGAREISSVVDGVERISRESLHKPSPETEQEAGFAFWHIQNKFKPVMQAIMYYHNGVRLTVTCAADNSRKMSRLREAVLSYVRANFPEIEIQAFGRAQIYPAMDQEIVEGKPWNVGSDQWIIYFVFLNWLLIAKRKTDEHLPILRPGLGAAIMNIPTWFATMVLLLIMVHYDMPLDLANAVISAFTINATSDFSFHLIRAFLENLQQGKNGRQAMAEVLEHDSRTIVEDCFLNIRIFLPLYFFCLKFVPIQRIGIMMLLMLTLCLIGILILVPPLLVLAVKEKKQKKILLEIESSPAWRIVSK